MRKQRRYTSEQEILDCIDKQYKRIEELKAEAVKQAWLVENCENNVNTTGVGCYDHDHQGNADRCWRSIENIQNNKLRILGECLSAFRTQTMPFLGDDKGVVYPT